MSSLLLYRFLAHKNPESEVQRNYTHDALNDKTERESVRVNPLDSCLRVIVNNKPQNLEKTTSSVLSVLLLIYDSNLGFKP